MRGIIELPLEQGRQELGFYIGTAAVAGSNQLNPVVPLLISKDADFVAKRMWFVEFPYIGTNPLQESLLPQGRTTFIPRDGGTKRGLQLVPGFTRAFMLDASNERALAAWLGLPSPLMLRNNTNLFVEVSNPDAAATPWAGDLHIVCEGFKQFPANNSPELAIPRTIQQYAVPFALNGNFQVTDPQATPLQFGKIVNDGSGKMLVKGMNFRVLDSAGADITALVRGCLAFNFADSTSGGKPWVNNPSAGAGIVACPSQILTLNRSFGPWNTPRFVDENAVIDITIYWTNVAAALAYLNGLGNFPWSMSIALNGALLPR